MKINTTIATLALTATTALGSAQVTPQYRIIDLGAVNGSSEAFAINNNGQTVGWTFRNDGTYAACVWENGQLTLLQTTGPTSSANAINESGRIVGKRGTRAVEFTALNRVRDLGTFGGGEGTCLGINDTDRISGSFQNNQAQWKAAGEKFNYGANTFTRFNLGTLGGLWSSAQDVNNVNVYAGWSHTQSGPTHAALFVENQAPQDLGTLGGPQSEAKAISDYFGVTGFSEMSQIHNAPTNKGRIKRAFLWTPERRMQNLGEPYFRGQQKFRDSQGRSYFKLAMRQGEVTRTLSVYGIDTFGFGVNRRNVVCGNSRLFIGTSPFQVNRAMVSIKGVSYDLNNLAGNPTEWNLDRAWGINDSDTIVGRGFNYRTGTMRAYMAVRTR
jgi:probable HAF family extracellular repeat protein